MASVGVVLDLLSKAAVFAFCDDPWCIIPQFLTIRPIRNYGGVWGIGKGCSLLFLVVSVVALAAILIFRRRYRPRTSLAEFAFGLLIAGALGNVWDRLVSYPEGYVRDFIDVQLHLPRLEHWPTFNLADAFICVGVFLLLIHGVAREEKSAEDGKPS